jgi:hypothetical protein
VNLVKRNYSEATAFFRFHRRRHLRAHRFLAAHYSRPGPALVGGGGGGMSSRSRRRFSPELEVGSQRMDGSRPYTGLDQHKNNSRCGVLPDSDSYWNYQTMVGKGSHGPAVETRPPKLPYAPHPPATVAPEEAILKPVKQRVRSPISPQSTQSSQRSEYLLIKNSLLGVLGRLCGENINGGTA